MFLYSAAIACGWPADNCPSLFVSWLDAWWVTASPGRKNIHRHFGSNMYCIPPLFCFCMKCLYRIYQSQKNKWACLISWLKHVQKCFLIMLDNRKVTRGPTASVSCLDKRVKSVHRWLKKTLVKAAFSWLHTLPVPRAVAADALNKLVFVPFDPGRFSSHRRFAVKDLAETERRCSGWVGIKREGNKSTSRGRWWILCAKWHLMLRFN